MTGSSCKIWDQLVRMVKLFAAFLAPLRLMCLHVSLQQHCGKSQFSVVPIAGPINALPHWHKQM